MDSRYVIAKMLMDYETDMNGINAINEEDYDEIAEGIVKLFAIPDVINSVCSHSHGSKWSWKKGCHICRECGEKTN